MRNNKYLVKGYLIENESSTKISGELMRGNNYSFVGGFGASSLFGGGFTTDRNFSLGFIDPNFAELSMYWKRFSGLSSWNVGPIFTGFFLTKTKGGKNNLVGEYYGSYSEVDENNVLGLEYLDNFDLWELMKEPSRMLKSLEMKGYREGLFGYGVYEEIRSNFPELGGLLNW